ncbi:MAG: lipopolysaccharide biosynthesis protein [Burkholderiaceae bacterium]
MTSRQMIRHTINHLGVVAASKVMPLASLLIYSQFLSPAEYGVVSLFVSYIWIFGIILSLNLHTAIGRFIYEKTAQAGELIGTTLLPIGAVFVAGILIAAWDVDRVANFLSLPRSTIPLLFATAVGQIAESLLIQVLTARERSGSLFAAIAFRSGVSLVSTLLLFHALTYERYLAVLWAEAATNALFTIYLLLVLSADRPWSFSSTQLRNFAGYSLPLIPYMLSLTLISQFDRIMLDRAFDKEAVGIFSIGYNLGILLVMVAGALINALNPRFFSAMGEQRYDDIRCDARAVFSVCALCAFGLVLFGPALAGLVIPNSYEAGFALIPVIALGGLASVVFQIWARVIFYTKKTYQLSLIAISAAVLKIGLNVMFIPMLGFWGAALTTLLAYGFMAAATVVVINANFKQFRVSVAHEAVWFACLGALVAIERFMDLQGFAALALKASVMMIVVVIAARSFRPFIRPSSAETMTP